MYESETFKNTIFTKIHQPWYKLHMSVEQREWVNGYANNAMFYKNKMEAMSHMRYAGVSGAPGLAIHKQLYPHKVCTRPHAPRILGMEGQSGPAHMHTRECKQRHAQTPVTI